MSSIEKIQKIELYAWLGEDEMGSGKIGIKQARVPAGMIPIVSVDLEKINKDFIKKQMDFQGKAYKKSIKLCRFVFDGVVEEVGEKDE